MHRHDLGAGRRRAGPAALLIASLLAGLAGCTIPVPVGDPDHARAEPGVAGVWLTNLDEGAPLEYAGTLFMVEPLTRGTWLVTGFSFSDRERKKDGAKSAGAEAAGPAPAIGRILDSLGEDRAQPECGFPVFRAWLATLGGERFLVLEPRADPELLATELKPQAWMVFRVELEGSTARLRLVRPKFDKLASVTRRSEAEAIIARHARDPDLYKDQPLTLARVPWSRYAQVAALMERVRKGRP